MIYIVPVDLATLNPRCYTGRNESDVDARVLIEVVSSQSIWRFLTRCGGDDVGMRKIGCAAEEFEGVFVADSGDERRVPWSQLPALVEELGRPARPFS